MTGEKLQVASLLRVICYPSCSVSATTRFSHCKNDDRERKDGNMVLAIWESG